MVDGKDNHVTKFSYKKCILRSSIVFFFIRKCIPFPNIDFVSLTVVLLAFARGKYFASSTMIGKRFSYI